MQKTTITLQRADVVDLEDHKNCKERADRIASGPETHTKSGGLNSSVKPLENEPTSPPLCFLYTKGHQSLASTRKFVFHLQKVCLPCGTNKKRSAAN